MSVKRYLRSLRQNFHGWRTKRKVVIIESDDWGAIRMPSAKVALEFKNLGYNIEKCPYNQFDCLESNSDLIGIIDVLSKFKDHNYNSPILTANTIVANPDFRKISDSQFNTYFFKSFFDTYKEYPNTDGIEVIWKQAIDASLIRPQLHGREHLNVLRWMKDLINKDSEARVMFHREFYGLSTTISKEKRRSYLAAFELDNSEDILLHREIIKNASELFENLFGFKSISFIAPNYTWNSDHENVLNDVGIKFIQGGNMHRFSKVSVNETKYHNLGSKSIFNQRYLTRNCFFEPSTAINKDWIDSCLKEVSTAFIWNKPAIISSHRLNYIGSLHVKNRDKNLLLLKQLIEKIINKFPDVEFLSSDKLGMEIE